MFDGFVGLLGLAQARAEEPLVGTWQMIYQRFGDMKEKPLPLAMRITQSGTALRFEYLKGREQQLTMSFTVHLDGSEAEVKTGNGDTKASRS